MRSSVTICINHCICKNLRYLGFTDNGRVFGLSLRNQIGFIVAVHTEADIFLSGQHGNTVTAGRQIQRHIHSDGAAAADDNMRSQLIGVSKHIRGLPNES